MKDNKLTDDKGVRYILRIGRNIILKSAGDILSLPCDIPQICTPTTDCEKFEFEKSGHRYIALNVERQSGPCCDDYVEKGLREAYPAMTETDYAAAVKGLELLHWDSECRYCGVCGEPMRRATDISKICTSCGHEMFAPVSPAIIVLITKGAKALLVHARTFTRPFFGLVAGFVETGESLEECVRREVMEETSLQVKNIRYAGSQAWPFPNSLMLGFTAEYEAGELCFADGELTEGGFFGIDELPMLPGAPSIARRLIDEWIAARQDI